MKEIKHLQIYLAHIANVSRKLDPKQKKELAKILSVIITLLVSLKIGKVKFSWE